MLLADRFTRTVAPAIAAHDDGGIGTHTSSQISTWMPKWSMPAASKMRSVPKGTSAPPKVIERRSASRAAANCRFS